MASYLDTLDLNYLNGFGNEFESEAAGFEGAIPRDQINPQRCKLKLFAEQLSGSAFTAPRLSNRRSWLYRRRPSVCHRPFKNWAADSNIRFDGRTDPNQKRWSPYRWEPREGGCNFVEGLHTLGYSDQSGCASSSVAIYIYLADSNMDNVCCVNSDGDFLIVPQQGSLLVTTEFGRLKLAPNEIAVVQQGMKFKVDCDNKQIRGYVLEVKGNHFELPNLGPIGANGLANPRDFQTPTAWIDAINLEKPECEFNVLLKFQNKMFEATQSCTPWDVAGWFGNYVPYKYNLDKFVSVNSVSVDHPDPSIFTVLTCPSIGKPGTALADFVIFPPRWECASNTFRPPYYHRNCMTEFMGLIKGQYQAKSGKFAPGGGSLHQSMLPHGPDLECFEMASRQDTNVPRRVADGTMAFMFETSLSLKLTSWALEKNVDDDYHKCWQGLESVDLADE